MLFNSVQFVLFFIIVTILYFELPHQHRWKLLLLASCYFYLVFKPVYILILGFTIVVDYFAGIQIEKSEGKRRKYYLVASLIANIGVLVIFKYWNFLNTNISDLLSVFSVKNPLPLLKILLPIGLSFHTFQAMSYTIEVYRGNQKAEKHFGIYSLYVMFYPQLVAGPIERPQNLLHQFYDEHKWDSSRFKDGFLLMLWGFFKKVVIADRLSMYVNEVFGNIPHQNSTNIIVSCLVFSFQIYCDFSGYSDIAIGCAKIMGFDLMTNFNNPYCSKNIAEYWKRWHISLSTWFKDYLYISLGGNRVSVPRWYANLFCIFLVSGIWHGANWTYIIWGSLHGVYMVTAIMRDKLLPKASLPGFVNVALTFGLISFGWVFFRAADISTSFVILKKLLTLNEYGAIFSNKLNVVEMLFSLALILLLILKDNYLPKIVATSNKVFYGWCFAFLVLIYCFGVFNATSFIYFQF
jgi:hypothetical protein